jgi:CheY-like chemotaxis protein
MLPAENDGVKHVLVVEDNEMNRDMLCRRLERKGYSVLVAADGIEGMDLAKAKGPDVIIMDLSLPRIDGWEACRRLKADPSTSQIPIIALTAHAMSTDREKALQAGCDDFDTKPVDFTRLLEKIERACAIP